MADRLLGRKSNAVIDQLTAPLTAIDHKDPIFDSETDEDVYFDTYRPELEEEHTAASYSKFSTPGSSSNAVTFAAFAEEAKRIIVETLQTNDINEMIKSLKEIGAPCAYMDYFVVRAVRISLDRNRECQKQTASWLPLLSDVKLLTRAHIQRGFEKLIQNADDIALDVPGLHVMLLDFLEAAVLDGVVDPIFCLRLPEEFLRGVARLDADRGVQTGDVTVAQQLNELRVYKTEAQEVINDFLDTGEAEEIKKFLKHHKREFGHELVKYLIRRVCDRSNRHCERVSCLLSDLYGVETGCLTSDDITLGFLRLLVAASDIQLDVPQFSDILSKFLARAVVDEVAPPALLQDCLRLNTGGQLGRQVCRKVKTWVIEERHHMQSERFRKIWIGTDPGVDDTKTFKKTLRALIFEFFDSGETMEAVREVNLMDLAPDQASELVRKLIAFSMERTQTQWRAALDLIVELRQQEEIDQDNVVRGFDDLFAALPDFSIDVPAARQNLREFFVPEAKRLGLLPSAYMDPLDRDRELEEASHERKCSRVN